MGGGLPSDQPGDWPSLVTVREYVRTIRSALNEKLAAASFEPGEHMRDGFPLETLVNVAIEHRLMHVETFAYMFHQLSIDRKISQSNAALLPLPIFLTRWLKSLREARLSVSLVIQAPSAGITSSKPIPRMSHLLKSINTW